jgi:hypothetical protein
MAGEFISLNATDARHRRYEAVTILSLSKDGGDSFFP